MVCRGRVYISSEDLRVGLVKSETAGSFDDCGRQTNALLLAME